MRVSVQLIDAESGNHLWAERFDRPLAELFDRQDEIVARLANALSAQLFAAAEAALTKALFMTPEAAVAHMLLGVVQRHTNRVSQGVIPKAPLTDSRRGFPRGEISDSFGAGDSRHAISGEIA